MKFRLATSVALLIALGACASSDNPLTQAPQITISSTGVATSAAPTTTTDKGPLAQVASQLGNVFSPDDASAINMACGTPVVDPIACTFYTDLANLANSLKSQTPAPATVGLLTLVEKARLAMNSIAAIGTNKLLAQTYVDGIVFVNDTKAKGLAVPIEITGLLNQIAGGLVAGAL